MNKRQIIPVLFLTLFLSSTSSFAFELGARGIYWFPSLDGSVRVDAAGVVGTTVDFDSDLGLDDEDFVSIEIFFGGGNHHFSLAYTDIDFSGQETLSRTIVFNGQTYVFNSVVDSTIEYQMVDFCYQYDFLDLENVLAGFSLGSVLQVKYLDGDVNLYTTGVDEKEDFVLPVPLLGLNLHMGILADILEARVRGTGITYSGNNMYELTGDISYTPVPFVDIHGGYKFFNIDFDEDDVLLNYDMAGPFIMLTVSF